MARYTVNVPEYVLGRMSRKMTANEFLVEFAESKGGKTSVFTLSSPLRLVVLHPDRVETTEKIFDSIRLFRRLNELAHSKSVVVHVGSRGRWSLDALGLFALNTALHTPALRKGGLNIVRHFLKSRAGSQVALRGDFDELLSFLEIRPVFSSGKSASAGKAECITTADTGNASEPGIYYVQYSKRHNVSTLGRKRRRSARK